MKLVRHILLMAMLALAHDASAQGDVEYRLELGAGANLTSYQGDFSDALFKNMAFGGEILSRWIINPHSAVRFNLMLSQLKGDISGSNTEYPEPLKDSGYSFKNTLTDFSVSYEYNFLPYGTGRDYRGAKRVTPFISLGMGLTVVKPVVTGNIPIGLGVKYKVADRLNLALDWQFHLSFSDELDDVKDPYYIKSSGLFKNTDCYSVLSLTLTYSLCPKCVTCHNDKE